MSAVDDLLLELLDHPTDDEYLVYADAATTAGDPRGELIILQHALANHELTAEQRAELTARERELLDTHDELFAGLKPVFPEGRGLVWHNGFVRSARVDNCGLSQASRTIDHGLEIDEALEALLAHPSAVLVEELLLATDTADGTSLWTREQAPHAFGHAELSLIDRYRPYRLRRLVLNDRNSETDPEDPSYYDISWYKIAGMGPLSRGAPGLEDLVLIAGDFLDLEDLELPNLRSLAIRTGGLRRSRYDALLSRLHPSIERLELWFGREDYGADIAPDHLKPILDGVAFPNLHTLNLMNAEFTDELCEVLAYTKILPQLRSISLAMGCLSARGVAHLVRSRDAFAHLTSLDVSLSLLDRTAQERIQKALPQTRIGLQRGNRRYAMIGE
jgi:hypothetical protein